MNEDTTPEPADEQPDESTDETTGDETPAEETDKPQDPKAASAPAFRLPPGIAPKTNFAGILGNVDFSGILGMQAALRGLSAQMDAINRRHIASIRAAVNIPFPKPTLPAALIAQRSVLPPGFMDFRTHLAEQLTQVARVHLLSPEYGFGKDLGAILSGYQPKWAATIKAFVDSLDKLIPENLRGLKTEDLGAVFSINAEDGTSLAWAPRIGIVQELIAAPDMDARSAILVSHAAEIADDVEASLANVLLEEHQALRAMLLDSVQAIRTGLYYAAQATACNAFDTVVNVRALDFLGHTGKKKSRDLTRNHFRPVEVEDWEELPFADLELVLVGGGIATAFEWWTPGTGQASFNRNGSVHHVDDGSYTPAHAVRALLISHATLRWLDTSIREQQEQDEDAA